MRGCSTSSPISEQQHTANREPRTANREGKCSRDCVVACLGCAGQEDVLPRQHAHAQNLLGQVIPVDRERDSFGKIAVTSGHCSEPKNVAANGHSCALEHACESCPFFLVDPLERDGIGAKRQHLRVNLERAAIIQSPQHILDHYKARIDECTTIIDGIDNYIDNLDQVERDAMRHVLESMAEIRRRATAPRTIDLRDLLRKGKNDDKR